MSAFPPRRLLVPVDLTPVSAHAWSWAKRLASPGSAREALYAIEPMPAPVMGLPAPPPTRAGLRRLERRLAAAYDGASVRVETGDPALVIVRAARAADLVVMGSHGRRGLSLVLLGSVSEAVVRDAGVPVLVVRGRPAAVDSVLAPVNLMPYAAKGLELAAEAAAALGARLTVLFVAGDRKKGPNPRFFLSGLLSGLPEELRERVKPTLKIRYGTPVNQILKESSTHGLIVLTAHRKALLRDFVLGTTAERVLRHSRIPVLTAPSREAR